MESTTPEDARVLLAALERATPNITVNLDGHTLRLTNLDHVLWPATSTDGEITKRAFLAYLVQVSPWLLPHVHDRILTLAGYRDAARPPLYFQRHREHIPAFVETVRVYASSYRRDQTYLLCNNLLTLLWLGQINNLAVHVGLSRVTPEEQGGTSNFTGSKDAVEGSVLSYPDLLLFDLDPHVATAGQHPTGPPQLNPEGWEMTCEVALALHELLEGLGLPAFVKTSGATGLHVVVPVMRRLPFPTMQELSRQLALELQSPVRHVTLAPRVDARWGKVLVDYRQNGYSKSIPAPYSPRAQPGAPVSMPLAWSELPATYPTDFTVHSALARLTSTGDVWSTLPEQGIDIAAALSMPNSSGT